jgi:LacI family gluconate utilization system Gnt-I transcriptional repressor
LPPRILPSAVLRLLPQLHPDIRRDARVDLRELVAHAAGLGGRQLADLHALALEIGERAARMLLQLMRGEPVAERSVDVGYELVVRGST